MSNELDVLIERLQAEKAAIENTIKDLQTKKQDEEVKARLLAMNELCQGIKQRLRAQHPEWSELAIEEQMRIELGGRASSNRES